MISVVCKLILFSMHHCSLGNNMEKLAIPFRPSWSVKLKLQFIQVLEVHVLIINSSLSIYKTGKKILLTWTCEAISPTVSLKPFSCCLKIHSYSFSCSNGTDNEKRLWKRGREERTEFCQPKKELWKGGRCYSIKENTTAACWQVQFLMDSTRWQD